jgi:hypothetical protein
MPFEVFECQYYEVLVIDPGVWDDPDAQGTITRKPIKPNGISSVDFWIRAWFSGFDMFYGLAAPHSFGDANLDVSVVIVAAYMSAISGIKKVLLT